MKFKVWIDGPGPFPILRADPLDPPEQRSGHRGPFADRELFAELALRVRGRCVAAGHRGAGGSRNSWHLSLQIPRRDGPLLTEALTAYLRDLDDGPLRAYLRSAPGVRDQPRPGERWELV